MNEKRQNSYLEIGDNVLADTGDSIIEGIVSFMRDKEYDDVPDDAGEFAGISWKAVNENEDIEVQLDNDYNKWFLGKDIYKLGTNVDVIMKKRKKYHDQFILYDLGEGYWGTQETTYNDGTKKVKQVYTPRFLINKKGFGDVSSFLWYSYDASDDLFYLYTKYGCINVIDEVNRKFIVDEKEKDEYYKRNIKNAEKI